MKNLMLVMLGVLFSIQLTHAEIKPDLTVLSTACGKNVRLNFGGNAVRKVCLSRVNNTKALLLVIEFNNGTKNVLSILRTEELDTEGNFIEYKIAASDLRVFSQGPYTIVNSYTFKVIGQLQSDNSIYSGRLTGFAPNGMPVDAQLETMYITE
jgi:hypothetical protein